MNGAGIKLNVFNCVRGSYLNFSPFFGGFHVRMYVNGRVARTVYCALCIKKNGWFMSHVFFSFSDSNVAPSCPMHVCF